MKNNIGLVEFAKKALAEKWGYVWGTFGNVLTQILFDYKLIQYPVEVGRYKDFIRLNYINRRTADCVGLIKAYMWWEQNNPVYNATSDVSADGMFNAAAEKGTIDNMPEIPGLCVRYPGHIGVYIGNGQVIEARGTIHGVVQTALKGRGWTHWLKCPYISYGGYDMWEQKNKEFVKRFQSITGLEVDGKAGAQTNSMLDLLEPIIRGLTGQKNIQLKTLDNITYVEVDPLALGYVDLSKSPKSTTEITYKNFINGPFFFPSARPIWFVAHKGMIVYDLKPWDYDLKPKGTFIVYADGRVEVKTMYRPNGVANIHLAFQGFNLNYEANGSKNMRDSVLNESYAENDLRTCWRNGVGYNPSTKKVIIARVYGNPEDLRKAMRKLGCIDKNNDTVGIGVDAGASHAFVVNGQIIGNEGRKQEHIITF